MNMNVKKQQEHEVKQRYSYHGQQCPTDTTLTIYNHFPDHSHLEF